jgi:hypothetical protein
MDPRKLLDFLTSTLRDTNPALVHVLSKMESVVMNETAFLAMPDSINEEDMQGIMKAMADLPEEATGGLTLKPMYKFNQQFADKETKAVISEALNDISEKCGGELKLIPSKVAYFIIIAGDLSEEDKASCRESIQLFGADKKFHRVILAWAPDEEFEILEFEGGKVAAAPKQQIKPEIKNLTKISELDDPARQRTRAILQDDILDLRILLGRSMDVMDVINGLDTLGVSHGD